jgi:hypothetical protein
MGFVDGMMMRSDCSVLVGEYVGGCIGVGVVVASVVVLAIHWALCAL